jgi:hypothetical protein
LFVLINNLYVFVFTFIVIKVKKGVLLLTYTRLREFLRGMADVRGEGVTNSDNAGQGGEGGLEIHHLAGHLL